MNNIIKTLLTVSLTVGLLVGCAQPNPHPMDMSVAVKSAKSDTDHAALAAHYEQAAKEAEAKVEEHKKLLGQYQEHSYLYGKQAATLEEHCESLITSYEKVAASNTAMAKMHRQMITGAK
jgi:hypothetical protein